MREPNALAIVLGVIAIVSSVILLLDVRTPEVIIALGLAAAGAGIIVLAVPR